MPDPAGTGTSRPASWSDLISAEATKQGIDPRLAVAVAQHESSLNPQAVSKVGARGLMQLMPETAARLGVNIDDPIDNIRGGISELKRLLDEHQGDVVMALRRYNGSPRASEAATQPYVDAILGKLQASQPAATPATVGQPPQKILGPAPTGKLHTARPVSAEDFARPTRFQRFAQVVGPAAEALDYRTPEGRRNLAGGAGAAAATAATGGLAGIPAAIAAIAGAGAGGMIAESGEQIAGTHAPSEVGVAGAGAEQSAYELGGQLFMWPIKAIGRRVLASQVGQAAHAALKSTREATLSRLSAALDAASEAAGDVRTAASQAVRYTRRQVGEAVRGVRGRAGEAVEAVEGQGRDLLAATRQSAAEGIRDARKTSAAGVTRATETGAAGVEAATSKAAERTAAAEAPYAAMVAKPPSAALAGQKAAAVVRGPAQEARDLAGQAVEAAAKEGPPVDITALKAEAQQIVERLRQPEATFPRRLAEGEAAAAAGPGGFVLGEGSRRLLEQQAAAGDATAAATLRALVGGTADELASAQATAARETLKHPAMGVLNRLLNAEDVVPFHDVHLWKSELQNALAGTYDQAVKKQVTSLTEKVASGLRDSLRGHAPYDQATAAYAQIAPLYTKEIGAKIRKVAQTSPESLVGMISPKKPTAVRMLRDLLVGQSAAVGKEGEGQAAWDLVRSAWTHANVLKGGIGKLGENLDRLPEEFAGILYGDPSGQAIQRNLRTIAAAYKAAVDAGAEDVAAARAAQAAGVAEAKATGRAGMEAARTQGRAAVASTQVGNRAALDAARATAEQSVESAQRAGRSQVEQAIQQGTGVRRQAQQDIRAARAAKRSFARTPTAEEARFAASSIAGRQPTVEELAAHGIRALTLGPAQIWGGLSWMKLLSGPAEKDLIEWAAYSPQNTQRLVKLMTGPSPTGMAIADTLRAAGVLEDRRPAARRGRGQVGQPPPR